jgi:hypothetical protein
LYRCKSPGPMVFLAREKRCYSSGILHPNEIGDSAGEVNRAQNFTYLFDDRSISQTDDLIIPNQDSTHQAPKRISSLRQRHAQTEGRSMRFGHENARPLAADERVLDRSVASASSSTRGHHDDLRFGWMSFHGRAVRRHSRVPGKYLPQFGSLACVL